MDATYSLSPPQLTKYMRHHNEEEYILIDVRQPGEYSQEHIPGATFIPLMELESKFFSLPSNRDILFYCRSGARSAAAATLASDLKVTKKKIYNLNGGIIAWKGKTLTDVPKLHLFSKAKGIPELLLTAMNLEKGAWRFYMFILNHMPRADFHDTIESLSKEEHAHAYAVYQQWCKQQDTPEPFDKLFDRLEGDILENGMQLKEMVGRVALLDTDSCLDIIELSLNIEYSAYDLYRTLAEQTKLPECRKLFLSIAQVEKTHMQLLIKAIDQICQ